MANSTTRGARKPRSATRKTYRLRSIHQRHRVVLKVARDTYDSLGSRRTAELEKGIMLEFEDWLCTVDEPTMELVRESPCFTGIGEPRSIYIDGQPDSPGPPQRVRTTKGAISVRPAPINPLPPITGWDAMSGEEITQLLEQGSVTPEVGIAWERAHRNRSVVLRACAIALFAMHQEAVEEPDPSDIVGADEEVFGPEDDEPVEDDDGEEQTEPEAMEPGVIHDDVFREHLPPAVFGAPEEGE